MSNQANDGGVNDCHTECLHNCNSLSVSAITFVTRSKTNMAIRQRLGGGGGVVGRVGGGHGQLRSGAREGGGGNEVVDEANDRLSGQFNFPPPETGRFTC